MVVDGIYIIMELLGETCRNIFRTDRLWTFHYRLVCLNSVITYVDDSEGEDMDKQYIKGQALVLRGWALFRFGPACISRLIAIARKGHAGSSYLYGTDQ